MLNSSSPPSPSPPPRRSHGARTPLTEEPYLLLGHAWTPDDCGTAYAGGAALRLQGAGGGPPPPSPGDEAQKKCALPGGACHKGELTKLGQRQAVGLGRWLRERYGAGGPDGGAALLPGAYREGVVEAHTTKYSRTRATLRGVLTGGCGGCCAVFGAVLGWRRRLAGQGREGMEGAASSPPLFNKRVPALTRKHRCPHCPPQPRRPLPRPRRLDAGDGDLQRRDRPAALRRHEALPAPGAADGGVAREARG